MKSHKEIHEGYNGSGRRVHLVVTVDDKTGRWLWTETFTSQAEAISWKTYA